MSLFSLFSFPYFPYFLQKEEKVIRLRFGLGDGRPRTLEEIGTIFNLTRERVRQIEAKALQKLRHPSRAESLRRFFDLSP